MKKSIVSVLLSTASLMIANNCYAQSSTTTNDSEKVVELPPITIVDEIDSAAQAANTEKKEAPNAISVIDAEQLNQFGDQPLGDAMRRLPGVSFPGGNRARDLQLRGIGTEYSQVLVNGRALLDANSKRGVQLDRIPSSMVERIEIIRSPLATQDGQGAAGTVNIILKNQNYDPITILGVGGGYLEENGAIGDTTYFQALTAGNISATLSGGLQRQRRNESKDTYSYDGAGVADGGKLEQNERRFDQANFTPSFEIQASDHDILKFEPSFLWTKETRKDVETDLTTDHSAVNRREFETRIRKRRNIGLYGEWQHEIKHDLDLTLALDYQNASEDTERDATRYTAAGAVNRVRQRTEDIELNRVAPEAKFRYQAGDHTVDTGIGFIRTTRDESSTEVTNGVIATPNPTRQYEIEENRWNAYLQDDYQLTAQDRLTMGLRAEATNTVTTDATGTDSDKSHFIALPSANLVHSLETDTDLRFGIARTVRRPDLRELSPSVSTAGGTIANPDTGGNPDLEPEEIWGIDAGVDQYFADDKGLFSVNTFARHFDNKIETVTTSESGRFVKRSQNVGEGYMVGLEAELRVPLTAVNLDNVTVWGNITGVKTELDVASTGETRRFLDQPDYFTNIGIDWFVPEWRTTFGATMNYNSGYDQHYKQADGTSISNDIEDVARFDLSARTEVTENVTLTISALNIFAQKEKRLDRTYDASGALTGYSTTEEPTYRSVYVRLSTAF